MQPPLDPTQPSSGANGQPPFPPQGQFPQGQYPPGQYGQQSQYPGGPGPYSQQNQQGYAGQAWPGGSPMAAPRQSIDLGSTLSTTFKLYKASLGKFLGISAITTAISLIIAAVAVGVFIAGIMTTIFSNLGSYDSIDRIIPGIIMGSVVFTVLIVVLSLVVTWAGSIGNMATADAGLMAQDLPLGKALGIGFKKAFSTVPVILIIAALAGALTWLILSASVAGIMEIVRYPDADPSTYIVAMLGSIALVIVLTLVLVVVSYVIQVKCFLTFPIMVAEGLGVLAAAKKSWSMTKGTAGMIFVVVLLTGMAIGAVSQVIAVPATIFLAPLEMSINSYSDPTAIFASMGGLYAWIGISSFVVSLFTMPIMPIITAVVYRDRKALGL